jgi:tetratricopeptide (TPR) repeat protein
MTSADANALDARYRNGNALRIAGDFVAAEAEFHAVLARDPAHRDAAYSLAFMLREQGRTGAAATAIASWWSHAATSAEEALAAIGFVIECADYPHADAIARDAHERWPTDARCAARAGEIALALGAFERATALLRDALDHAPEQAMAWLRLAHCKRVDSADDPDLRRFRDAWDRPALDRTAHICAGFALAKALDDVGEYARAIEVLRPANAAAKKSVRWDPRDWQRLLDARARMPRLSVDPEFIPVFVVGMTRTGTTLVADTLARYVDVRDRGELNWIGAMHDHLLEQNRLVDVNALTAVAELIHRQMRRDDTPARFYIDKNPLNFRHLDLVAALFPQAKIVHCVRSARDTALSLWMQHFAHADMGFAYDFEAIAQAQRLEAEFMQRWRVELGISICRIEYEDVVANPDDAQRRLAAHLGISTPPQTDNHIEAITTASVWQVRQPVYARSVGRWKNYATFLPELAAQFAD